jgi:hypothetical protein
MRSHTRSAILLPLTAAALLVTGCSVDEDGHPDAGFSAAPVASGPVMVGSTATIEATITNQGTGAVAIPWEVRRGTSVLASGTTRKLTTGETSPISVLISEAAAGVYTYTVILDPQNRLDEESHTERVRLDDGSYEIVERGGEGDNQAAVTVTVTVPVGAG